MILKKQKLSGLVIDLTRPQNHEFILENLASQFCDEKSLDKNEILSKMREKDFEHMVLVFDSYFGDRVTILR